MTDTLTLVPESTEPVLPKGLFRYAGMRQGATVPLVHLYLADDGERLLAKKPLSSFQSIGSVIEVVFADETHKSFYTSGKQAPALVDQTEASDPRLIDWAIDTRTARTAKAMADRQKQVAKGQADPLLDTLAPIRERLAKMLPDQRAAALASITAYLLTGRRS